MDKRLAEMKDRYDNANIIEHLEGIDIIAMSVEDKDWFIQQAEEKQRLEEKLKYLESRGLQEINLGNVGVDANELVDEVRQALEESQ